MTPDQPWDALGYSDIARAEIVAGVLQVAFDNGDIVNVPGANIGDLEGASVTVDPDEALEVVVNEPGGDIVRISWTRIRAATDPAFAQHLRESDAEESRRLGRRLKALREDRGMRQAQLASLVNMTPPQLSKIEAGSHDMRVSTVRSLLRALDASFADVSGDDAPEISVKQLAKKVASAGVSAEAAHQLFGRVPRQRALALLERAIGWTQQGIREDDLRLPPFTAAVQFKSATQPDPEAAPLIRLSWAVARAGRTAADVGHYAAIPNDPTQVRAAAMSPASDVTLASLLDWSWQQGIPVLPMLGRGVFSASVWDVEERPVVVLKEARDLAVFWLFDLAHELGHIARGHITAGALIDLTSPTALGNIDQQESEANEFALNLLVPHYPELLAEVRDRARGNYLAFKGAVAATAAHRHVSPGVLGMLAAHEMTEVGEHKDRWGSATNLAKADGEGRALAVEAARRRLILEPADELDAALLRTIVLGD